MFTLAGQNLASGLYSVNNAGARSYREDSPGGGARTHKGFRIGLLEGADEREDRAAAPVMGRLAWVRAPRRVDIVLFVLSCRTPLQASAKDIRMSRLYNPERNASGNF